MEAVIERELVLGGVRARVAVPEDGELLALQMLGAEAGGAWEPCIRGNPDEGVALWCLWTLFLEDGTVYRVPRPAMLGEAMLGTVCRLLAGAGRRAVLMPDACVLADSGRALVVGGSMYAEATPVAVALSERAVLAPHPGPEDVAVSAAIVPRASLPRDEERWRDAILGLEQLLPPAVLAERPWGYVAVYPRAVTASPDGAFGTYSVGAAVRVAEKPARVYSYLVGFLYAVPEAPVPLEWYTSREVLAALLDEAERTTLTGRALELARKNKNK